MSFEKPLAERERALEEVFFHKRDEELIDAMRLKREKAEDEKALANALGIEDTEALASLLEAGFRAETAVALSIVPLVAVGWANGSIETEEREAILRAAHSLGVPDDGPAHELLVRWLKEPVTERLIAAWALCISDRCDGATPAERRALRSSVMERARAVAKKSGGFLGLHSISARERKMLARLEESFGVDS